MEVDIKILLNDLNTKKLLRPYIWYTVDLKRIPRIDETFELEIDDKTTYYGKVTSIETYRRLNSSIEKVYVTIKEFD